MKKKQDFLTFPKEGIRNFDWEGTEALTNVYILHVSVRSEENSHLKSYVNP